MSQTTNAPLCIFCAVEMTPRTIFGKQVYECPRCKRRVPAENIVQEVENAEGGGECGRRKLTLNR